MATKYLDLTGLQKYDAKIKEVINAGDAKSIKKIIISDDTVYLFKDEAKTIADIAAADYSFALAGSDVTTLQTRVGSATALNEYKEADDITKILNILTGADTVEGSLAAVAKEAKVTVEAAETAADGYLKTYEVKQNGVSVGTIDIPKDLVVTSGTIEVNPEGQEAGTYLKLTIANQEAPVYINVKDLVDTYTAAAGATQVQVVISEANEISASIVAGSVDTTALSEGVVASLGKADTALQEGDIDTATDEDIDALFA